MSNQWWIGSHDGQEYVISDSVKDLPGLCTPAPLQGPPTPKQIQLLLDRGCTVLCFGVILENMEAN